MAQLQEATFRGGKKYTVSVPYVLKARWNQNHGNGDEAEVKFVKEYVDDAILNYDIEFSPGPHAGRIDNVQEEAVLHGGRGVGDQFVKFLKKIGGADHDEDLNTWVAKDNEKFKRYYESAVEDEIITTKYDGDDFNIWLSDAHNGEFDSFEEQLESSLDPLDFEDTDESEVQEALDVIGDKIEALARSDGLGEYELSKLVKSVKYTGADTNNRLIHFEVVCDVELTPVLKASMISCVNQIGEQFDDEETEVGFADGMLQLVVCVGQASTVRQFHRVRKTTTSAEVDTDSTVAAYAKNLKSKVMNLTKLPIISGARRGIAKTLNRAAKVVGEADIEAEADRLLADPLYEGPAVLPDEPGVKPDTDYPGVDDPDAPSKPSKPEKPAPETNPFKRPRINPGEEPRPKAYSPAAAGLKHLVKEGSDFAPFLNIRNRRNRRKLKRRVNESTSGTFAAPNGVIFTVDADDREEIEALAFVPASLATTPEEAHAVADSTDSNGLITPDFTFCRTEPDGDGWSVFYTCCEECQNDADDEDAFYGDDDGMAEGLGKWPSRRALTEALDIKGACRVCHDSGCPSEELAKIRDLADGKDCTVKTNNGAVKVKREGDQYHVGQDKEKS